MGYYKDGNIDCFKPDNTPDELWIPEWGIVTGKQIGRAHV